MNSVRTYHAVIWQSDADSEKSGQRVSIAAESLSEAKELLEKQYGKGTVFNLHNPQDSEAPRDKRR